MADNGDEHCNIGYKGSCACHASLFRGLQAAAALPATEQSKPVNEQELHST